MCACNGTGGIHTEHSWGISFAPCPDTDCKHDRVGRQKQYDAWKQKVIAELGDIFNAT